MKNANNLLGLERKNRYEVYSEYAGRKTSQDWSET
jgi:hypothetical protein